MIRAFPETGLIFVCIDGTVRLYAPEPFTVLAVYKILLDILPAIDGILQTLRLLEMLPQVEITYCSLSLDPLVTIIIHMVTHFLIDHSSLRCKSLR